MFRNGFMLVGVLLIQQRGGVNHYYFVDNLNNLKLNTYLFKDNCHNSKILGQVS